METVTQQIGAFVRDNGGNTWDALNVALARLDLATARAEAAEAEVARLREALAVAEPYLYNAPLEGAIDAWQIVCEILFSGEVRNG